MSALPLYVRFHSVSFALKQTRRPSEFSFIFENIRDEVAKKWPEGPERYTAVSGFIFLRFFCPAILRPSPVWPDGRCVLVRRCLFFFFFFFFFTVLIGFRLVAEHPNGNAARTLTLIAKILQVRCCLFLLLLLPYETPILCGQNLISPILSNLATRSLG